MSIYDNIPSCALYRGIRYMATGMAMLKDVGYTRYNWGLPKAPVNPSASGTSGGSLAAGTYKIHNVPMFRKLGLV